MRKTPAQYQCEGAICRVWSHWLNPLGNWLEPHPYPEKRAIQAGESWLPADLWWAVRNPFANFMSHWVGIVPVGARYETIAPEDRGWERVVKGNWSWWRKGWMRLPYYRVDGTWTFYVGWTSRGNLGFAWRRNR